MITKGMTITVMRGVKVPRGTTGEVFWTGDTKYGRGSGSPTRQARPTGPRPGTWGLPAPVAQPAATTDIADLESRLAALETAFAELTARLAA